MTVKHHARGNANLCISVTFFYYLITNRLPEYLVLLAFEEIMMVFFLVFGFFKTIFSKSIYDTKYDCVI